MCDDIHESFMSFKTNKTRGESSIKVNYALFLVDSISLRKMCVTAKIAFYLYKIIFIYLLCDTLTGITLTLWSYGVIYLLVRSGLVMISEFIHLSFL